MAKAFIHIAVLLGCQPAWAQAAFFRKDVAAGDRPLVVIAGDFNRDSRQDLAVNSFSGFSVLLNNGNANFARPVKLPAEIHPMFGPTPTNYTLAADFNRDGWLDVAGTIDATSPPLPPTRIDQINVRLLPEAAPVPPSFISLCANLSEFLQNGLRTLFLNKYIILQ